MKFDQLSDEQLACYLQDNNGEGVEELITRYEKPLLRYARRLIGDEDAAEDAIQNTFISAYQNINSYDPKRKFSPWIYRIAHNKAINEARSKKPQVGLEEISELPDHHTGDISEKLDLASLRNRLNQSIGILPNKYKEVIILRFFEEKTYEEVSEILKIPVSTVGVRIKRGLERLKYDKNINLEDLL